MMKKWLMILLVVALCLSWVAGALAQADFLEAMSREELLTLQKEVEKKLNPLIFEEKWLSGEPVTLEPGLYTIGKDVPRGRWKLDGVETEAPFFGLGTRLLDETGIDGKTLIYANLRLNTIYPEDYVHTIDCQNGMYLQIVKSVILTKIE